MSSEHQGAWTYEGRFWIDPAGKVHRVSARSSHEEWANDVMDSSLECLFSKGWIRLQAFPQHYLLIDLQQAVTQAQAEALLDFFFDRLAAIPFTRIVVERQNHDLREFKAGENREAYAFVCNGRTAETENCGP